MTFYRRVRIFQGVVVHFVPVMSISTNNKTPHAPDRKQPVNVRNIFATLHSLNTNNRPTTTRLFSEECIEIRMVCEEDPLHSKPIYRRDSVADMEPGKSLVMANDLMPGYLRI